MHTVCISIWSHKGIKKCRLNLLCPHVHPWWKQVLLTLWINVLLWNNSAYASVIMRIREGNTGWINKNVFSQQLYMLWAAFTNLWGLLPASPFPQNKLLRKDVIKNFVSMIGQGNTDFQSEPRNLIHSFIVKNMFWHCQVHKFGQ